MIFLKKLRIDTIYPLKTLNSILAFV